MKARVIVKNDEIVKTKKGGALIPVSIRNFRAVYPVLTQPDENDKFRVVLMIPKEEKGTYKEIKRLIDKMFNELSDTVFAKNKAKNLHNPLKDGDNQLDKDGDEVENPVEAFEGHWYFNASSYVGEYQVKLLDKRKKIIAKDDTETITDNFYSGVHVHGSLSMSAYSTGDGGITFYMNKLMSTGEGERIGFDDDNFDDIEVDEYEDDDFDDEL